VMPRRAVGRGIIDARSAANTQRVCALHEEGGEVSSSVRSPSRGCR
jgi:hypothetical protein